MNNQPFSFGYGGELSHFAFQSGARNFQEARAEFEAEMEALHERYNAQRQTAEIAAAPTLGRTVMGEVIPQYV